MIARGVQAYQDELSFYQRFHRHPVNWRIHAVAVPLEWFGWLLALGLAPRRLLHWPFGVSVGVYHALVVRPAGLAVASFLAQIAMAVCVDRVVAAISGAWHVLAIAVTIHASSWAVQVLVGHYRVEKNKPGLATQLTLNSVLLSVPMAWHAPRKEDVPDEAASLSKLTIRGFCDTLPTSDGAIIYPFQHTDDNAASSAQGAADLWAKLRGKGARILCFQISNEDLAAPIPNFSGSERFLRLLAEAGVPSRAVILRPWRRDCVHTLNEAEEAARVTFRELEAPALVVVSIALHLPRALLTTLSVVSRMMPAADAKGEKDGNSTAAQRPKQVSRGPTRPRHYYPVHSFVGAPLSWGAMVAHSQGVVMGTREELMDSELGRIKRYREKGDLIPPSKALALLRARGDFETGRA
jgi:uncharacterized membrane protein YGL010W